MSHPLHGRRVRFDNDSRYRGVVGVVVDAFPTPLNTYAIIVELEQPDYRAGYLSRLDLEPNDRMPKVDPP